METEDVYALSLAAEGMDLPYREAKKVFERKYLEDLLPRCETHQDAANRMGMHRERPNPYASPRHLAAAWNKGFHNLDPGPMAEGSPYDLADREEVLKKVA